MAAPVRRAKKHSAFDGVRKAIGGTAGSPGIAADAEELARRVARVQALAGCRAVELSPYVVGLLAGAGRRELFAVPGRLHAAQA